jgi:hypothetical protein
MFLGWDAIGHSVINGRRGPLCAYHRMANAGRLRVWRVVLIWPLPWAKAVRDLPGYGYGRPSGVLSFFGWYDAAARETR